MKLTPKQERFCQEYVVDLNGTQAAIRAGYSERTANPTAARLLAKVSIRTFVQKLKTEVADRLDVTTDEVINGLREVAVNGKSDSARVRAYELLGKHLGMFTGRLEVAEESKPQFVFYWPHNGRDVDPPLTIQSETE